ncbi:MAG: RNase adapter RapZ [Gammaproteobacteria bacterium]|jgi:UPF0042 nucleotide-binding protein
MRLIIVSGLSGSGKSVALDVLEDLEFFCVDNLPAPLLEALVPELETRRREKLDQTAIGVDARSLPQDLDRLPAIIGRLREKGFECELIYLFASDDVLVSRFSETRRRHPLSRGGLGLKEAIATERGLLAPIQDAADLVIDTSRSSVAELRSIVRRRVAGREQGDLALLFESFGFKHGLPTDADYVFDVRCLPNPYWDTALRPLTGLDADVKEFLSKQPSVDAMLGDIGGFLETWIPASKDYDRAYLTVAIGCTGGQHRSVYIAEQLASRFRGRYGPVHIRHNELATGRQVR